jgi:hypothetical protein
MLKKSILMPQNLFLDSKLKPKVEKLTILRFYHPKGRKKGGSNAEEALEKMTQSHDSSDPHPCLSFFLASVSCLRQKEIGKREENELGRRRCRAWEKEKEKKEGG